MTFQCTSSYVLIESDASELCDQVREVEFGVYKNFSPTAKFSSIALHFKKSQIVYLESIVFFDKQLLIKETGTECERAAVAVLLQALRRNIRLDTEGDILENRVMKELTKESYPEML